MDVNGTNAGKSKSWLRSNDSEVPWWGIWALYTNCGTKERIREGRGGMRDGIISEKSEN